MKRVVVDRFGGPEVMKFVEAEDPRPAAGEVAVRVVAAGVSFTDSQLRAGIYFHVPKPSFTPGYELVGVVEELGVGCSRLRVGDRVAALTVWGAYAERVCVPEAEAVEVPDDLDPAEVVCLVLPYMTAPPGGEGTARGASGFNVYGGSLGEAVFDSIITRGDGSVGVQVGRDLPKLTIKGSPSTSRGTRESLVKGALMPLSAIALSVKSTGTSAPFISEPTPQLHRLSPQTCLRSAPRNERSSRSGSGPRRKASPTPQTPKASFLRSPLDAQHPRLRLRGPPRFRPRVGRRPPMITGTGTVRPHSPQPPRRKR